MPKYRFQLRPAFQYSTKTVCLAVAIACTLVPALSIGQEPASFDKTSAAVQSKVVKIFGAGGANRLEGYQSGFLISGSGYIVTSWSYVLDDEEVTVVLADGQRFDAKLVGADPRVNVAVLKLPYDGEDLPHFKLSKAVTVKSGSRVLAFSNLYRVATGNEAVSVQHGVVSAVAPLSARSGELTAKLRGEVYYLDVITNNPGAAGGVLTDRTGKLAAMLGRELRTQEGNAWLNYAIPISTITKSIEAIQTGKLIALNAEEKDAIQPETPQSLAALGIVLIPDVVTQTPPFIDAIRPKTPATEADLKPDDLIVFVQDQIVTSCQALERVLATLEQDVPLRLAVIRNGEIVEIVLTVTEN